MILYGIGNQWLYILIAHYLIIHQEAMQTIKLLNYHFSFVDFNDILERIKKDILVKGKFCQIISINPENIMIMTRDNEFKKLVMSSQTLIVDGVGIVLAARLLTGTGLRRLPGVELMERLISYASQYSLRCLLIGGDANLAELTAKCYAGRYPKLKIWGLQAIDDIKQPKPQEMLALKQIVSTSKPCLVFVAFGSPAQERWIQANKELFKGCLVVGVGGGFAMVSGVLPRAPKVMQRLGLEWLFRLVRQPWRLKRQLNLISFLLLVIKAKFKKA